MWDYLIGGGYTGESIINDVYQVGFPTIIAVHRKMKIGTLVKYVGSTSGLQEWLYEAKKRSLGDSVKAVPTSLLALEQKLATDPTPAISVKDDLSLIDEQPSNFDFDDSATTLVTGDQPVESLSTNVCTGYYPGKLKISGLFRPRRYSDPETRCSLPSYAVEIARSPSVHDSGSYAAVTCSRKGNTVEFKLTLMANAVSETRFMAASFHVLFYNASHEPIRIDQDGVFPKEERGQSIDVKYTTSANTSLSGSIGYSGVSGGGSLSSGKEIEYTLQSESRVVGHALSHGAEWQFFRAAVEPELRPNFVMSLTLPPLSGTHTMEYWGEARLEWKRMIGTGSEKVPFGSAEIPLKRELPPLAMLKSLKKS
ncbi:hypothetical protein HWV62_34277 [Athelia sp. TMB]|nr:hypothetical protein HWV62_34277 [Athelia sp. TMB]